MADAAISFAVEKLGDALINKVSFLIGVEGQVRWVKDELQNMQCFLKDAAQKQGHDERIRQWISEVREVAHDAEDVIELFTLKVDAPTKKRDLVRKWAGFTGHVSHLNKVGKEIESIRSRLDEMAKRRERYGIRNLGEVGAESSSRSRSEMVELQRRMAARLQKDKDVVGLNEDADFLVKKVILDSKKGLSLATIVGMGGIGKSTLARKIYNYPAIAARFEKRAWVVVSSEFEAEDIMKQIMHELSVPLNAYELKTLESIQGTLRRQEILQQMLQKRLVGKHYFIVLDDLWEKTHWETLQTAFPDEQDKANRLLFTSRNQIITENRGYVHKMKLLSSKKSWKLLLKTAFMDRSKGRCPPELEEIGTEILEKCHGLPLAITVAGGLLVNQGESKSGWGKVLKQIKSYHMETSELGTSVSTILELSYQNLPSHLKPCFLCLAFFKEDAVIKARRLVHIWVALGLVQTGEDSVETAKDYLDELINRNLVLVNAMSIDDQVRYCYVHDLLRELSIRKAKEEIGFQSLLNVNEQGSSTSYKPRHLVVRGSGERLIWNDSSNQRKHLRSLFLNVDDLYDKHFTTSSYWKSLKLLRVLDIEGSMLWKFPSTIRELIGIRYLRLRETGILNLPSWLDVLKNLEVIDIIDCKRMSFPDVTWKMDSLRHFYIPSDCYFVYPMKESIWKNIETLKEVRASDLLFGDPVQRFGRRLCKLGIKVETMGGETETLLGRLLVECGVQKLHLRWHMIGMQSNIPIPNSLNNLTKLKLDGSFYNCPNADKFPPNITHLTLANSMISSNSPMQELGKLPNLLFLKLDHVFCVIKSIKVLYKGFPRLRVFQLTRMYSIKYIEIEDGGMAELQRLQIQKCSELQTENLREHFRSVEIIIINDA